MDRTPSPPRLRTLIVVSAVAVLPWSWFVLRDGAPIMDLVAAAIPALGVGVVTVAVIAAIVRRSWLPAVVAVSVAAFSVVAVAEPRTAERGASPRRPLRLVSANVFKLNDRPDAAARALLARRADVLAVIEGEPSVNDPLEAAYRHSFVDGLIAVHSRFPLRALPGGASIRRQRVLRARVWGPGGPFILYVVHQMNPIYDAGFGAQADDLRLLMARASSERQPVVLAGDFNMTDRSRGYRLMTASFRDAMRAGGVAGSTYDHGLWAALLLRIDHIFTVERWCAAEGVRFPIPGSDHEGIDAAIGPCPGTPIQRSRGSLRSPAVPTPPSAMPSPAATPTPAAIPTTVQPTPSPTA